MRHSLVILLAALVCLPEIASAGGQWSLAVTGRTIQAERVDLLLYVNGEHEDATVGFDVYRLDWGTVDERPERVRITSEPLQFPPGSTTQTYEIADTGLLPNRLYDYSVIGVDADRDPVLTWGGPDHARASAQWGVALLSEAMLEGVVWAAVTIPCPSSLLPPGQWEVRGPLTQTLLESPGYHRLFGVAGGDGASGRLLDVMSAEPMSCTLAVQPMSWSRAKSLYRD